MRVNLTMSFETLLKNLCIISISFIRANYPSLFSHPSFILIMQKSLLFSLVVSSESHMYCIVLSHSRSTKFVRSLWMAKPFEAMTCMVENTPQKGKRPLDKSLARTIHSRRKQMSSMMFNEF